MLAMPVDEERRACVVVCVQIAKETNVYESALFCGSVRRISSMAAMVDWAEGIGS